MALKGMFKNAPVLVQLLMLGLVVGIGIVGLYGICLFYLVSKFGASPEAFQSLLKHLPDYPDVIRNMQFFQTVMLFIFPAIVCARLFSDNYKRYLQIDTPVRLPVAGLAMLGMLVAVPFINCVYTINQQMVFPEWLKGVENWMKIMEEANRQTLEKILYIHSVWDLVFNIIIVCILAAVGEELIFRGLLQNIFAGRIRNPHLIIWMAAILFSAFHLQFYGFVPRLLLGAYLGYLLYYTKNIWIPISAHFTNNLFGIATAAIYQDKPEASAQIDAIGYGSTWYLSLASAALFAVIFREIKKRAT